MNIEQERAAFEAWGNKLFNYGFYPESWDGATEYEHEGTQMAWEGWQASAAARQAGEAVAWMRKWAYDGEKPEKKKNENGRMAWPAKFKFLAVTRHKIFNDDVALYTRLATVEAEQRTVKVPEVKLPGLEITGHDIGYAYGWNACRAEVLRMNGDE